MCLASSLASSVQNNYQMTRTHATFARQLYLKTNGFVPVWPFDVEPKLGDLFVIKGSQMVHLGNMISTYLGIEQEDLNVEENTQPIHELWQLESGIELSFKAKGGVYEIDGLIFPEDRHGLLVRFQEPGSFFFRAYDLHYKFISNFYQFSFKLLQQLAAERFSFREVFIVTSTAKAAAYALAVANQRNAHMLVSSPEMLQPNLDQLALPDFYLEIENMQGLKDFRLADKKDGHFFKAKKFEISGKGVEFLNNYIRAELPPEFLKYQANILNYAPLEMLSANEIYPASVHELFHFRDMSLNDVELLLA